MEIKFEKNGTIVTINGLEDLVAKNDIPEFVENMLWHVGQADVLKKRKNTVYGNVERNYAEYREACRFVEELCFTTDEIADQLVKFLKDEIQHYSVASIDRVYDFLGISAPVGSDKWGWTDISDYKVWCEKRSGATNVFHIWIPGMHRLNRC